MALPPATLSTSYIPSPTITLVLDTAAQVLAAPTQLTRSTTSDDMAQIARSSTSKGVLIGMLSAFGSAALVAIILAIVFFFRYTQQGRIFLDRIGRPGEFDDEQAFLREEAEALEEMDDLQRMEYMRAKGMLSGVVGKYGSAAGC